MPRTLVRRLALGAAGVAGAVAVTAAFLVALHAKEQDNRFCVACHLHEAKFERLVTAVPADLAGVHHRKDGQVGCITCHGGADLGMRLRVWAVAGFDTVKFLAGTYEEPDHMRLPLRDVECRQCHTPILKVSSAPPLPGAGPAAVDPALAGQDAPPADATASATSFHAISEHNATNVACVACHTTHTTDGDPAGRFIGRERVGRICRECHPHL
ncbi:MAG: hypothetical protein HYU41_10005 [Candidatus Rokubacteria bacterium]|nr:hypothetical protein [Candidatus Rokubacteria bacterium]